MTDVIFRNVNAKALKAITEILKSRPEVLLPEAAVTSPPTWAWTKEAALALMRDLGPRQRRVLAETAKAGGWLDARVMRQDGTGSLTGLTGPIQLAASRMLFAGKIPGDYYHPLTVRYDAGDRASRRVTAFEMHPKFVLPAFASAVRRLSEEGSL